MCGYLILFYLETEKNNDINLVDPMLLFGENDYEKIKTEENILKYLISLCQDCNIIYTL